jgi:lipoprotein-anchoring transpeptidase ErfK/SrfK
MVARRTFGRVLAAGLAVVMLSLTVAPAFADDGIPPQPTIAAGVTVGGIDVSGLTVGQAVTTITANVAAPTGTVVAQAAGSNFSLAVAKAYVVDASGLASAAVAATGPVEIPVRYAAVAGVVPAFVKGIASRVDVAAVNAARKIVKRRLKLTASKSGRSVDRTGAANVIDQALATDIAAGGSAQATVTVPVKTIAPKTTSKNIGKTIVVSLHERRVILYNGAKVEKVYRCAIGQPRYPTPVGTWKIVAKVKNPSWRNNGSAWAKNMPKYIGPGANNPLGTRALYLNASGIRIHGIPAHENSSIGRAASHGCIRLKNSDVVNLYPRVKVGTPVYVVK